MSLLAEAVALRLDKARKTFLFHSAGKDSNTIALSLAKAGLQEQVTLITHKSNMDDDECELSSLIAKKLGFKHKLLIEVNSFDEAARSQIYEHYYNVPFPCVDSPSLAYSLYIHQIPELKGANLIDGTGNDIYMGHIPSKNEYKKSKLAIVFGRMAWVRRYLSSHSILNQLFRTRSEWTGLRGLSPGDSNLIFSDSYSVSSYWKSEDCSMDYSEFRATIRGRFLDSEAYGRKVRNFADANNSNVIFPWMNTDVAKYVCTFDEKYLFDKSSFRNKLFLRDLIKDEIGVCADQVGKMGYGYNSRKVIENNYNWIESEILRCQYWNYNGVKTWLGRQKEVISSSEKNAERAFFLIYRVFLISIWLNTNRYISSR